LRKQSQRKQSLLNRPAFRPHARMALRWTATAMLEAGQSFRRPKAHKQLPVLRAALLRHQQALLGDKPIARKNVAA
jgi:hypothetical protein